MKSRCYRKKHVNFADYGGRGVTVCEAWRNSFSAFREWALSSGYEDGLEIDRRDTNGNYAPDNCRWATRKQQNRNTRKKRPDKSTSQFKGVFFNTSCKKWQASIRGSDGRTKYLGVFVNEIEAAQAYDAAAKEIQGEFARLNFQ